MLEIKVGLLSTSGLGESGIMSDRRLNVHPKPGLVSVGLHFATITQTVQSQMLTQINRRRFQIAQIHLPSPSIYVIGLRFEWHFPTFWKKTHINECHML